MNTTKLIKLFLALVILFFVGCKNKETAIQFGNFAGSAWNVPNTETLRMYDEMIYLFEQTNPNVTVSYKSGILRNDYSEWLASTILKGEEPDIFFILPEDFHLFADMGILYQLDDYIKESTTFPGCIFFDSAIQAGKQHGRQYAMPVESDPTLIFVNTTLLEKENIAFPDSSWTWDDFLNICTQVTKDTDGDGEIDQFGVQGFEWTTALYTNRALLFDESGQKGMFDSAEVYNAFDFLGKLRRLEQGKKVPDFDSGKVAFNVSSYSWYRAYAYYPYSILKNSGFVWKATSLPRGPNGQNAAELKTLLIGVSSRSKHKKEALAFLDFILTNGAIQTMILEKSKGIPARKDLLSRTYIRDIFVKDIRRTGNEISTEIILKSIDDAMVVKSFRRYEAAVSFIGKELDPSPSNNEVLKNSLSQLNIKINQFLSK